MHVPCGRRAVVSHDEYHRGSLGWVAANVDPHVRFEGLLVDLTLQIGLLPRHCGLRPGGLDIEPGDLECDPCEKRRGGTYDYRPILGSHEL